MFELHERYPQTRAALRHVAIARLPTPVERLAISARGVDLWVKRDDLTAGEYGGNKVRKLEMLLADAEAAHATRIYTYGAYASHQVFATSLYATRAGFRVTAALYPQPVTTYCLQNIRAIAGLGVELIHAGSPVLAPVLLHAAQVAHVREGGSRGEARARGYVFPAGASNALSNLGYVSAALELAGPVARGEVAKPDLVVVAAGTLGTAVGLSVGFALAKLDTRVLAVRVTPTAIANRFLFVGAARATLRLLAKLGVPVEHLMPRYDVVSGAFNASLTGREYGAGYGHATESGLRAIERFAACGIALDATYTAKAGAAALAAVELGKYVPPGTRNVLLWHTRSQAGIDDFAARGPSLTALAKPFARLRAETGQSRKFELFG